MGGDMAERVVVSLATVREAAGEMLAALGSDWASSEPGGLAEARADGAIDAVEALCEALGAGRAEIGPDGSVEWVGGGL